MFYKSVFKWFTLLVAGFYSVWLFASPEPAQNPYLALNGGSTMHGDAGSSDISPYAGTGLSPKTVIRIARQAACPTVLFGQDRMPLALCTRIFGRAPIVHLLDKETNQTLASLPIVKGSLLGGVYAYMDHHDRLVMVDGKHNLIRIRHLREGSKWHLDIAESIPLKSIVTGHCGGLDNCDGVVGLVPDWQGRVFIATKQGVVAVVNPENHAVTSIKLPEGERIDNSISSSPAGVSIATSHALYLLRADASGMPEVIWRETYDRGASRKPGQLSWGTGATPSFFGPATGYEYLTITDNADSRIHLLVYKTHTGELICHHPLFKKGSSGTENSAIAYNRSVYIANTYGYPYPQYPEGAGPSSPATSPFSGGMVRVDINPEGYGCKTIWESPVKSAAVPRLSSVDLNIYTVERRGLFNPGNFYYLSSIDSESGNILRSDYLGFGFIYNSLEMVGTIMPDGTWYQGVITGVVKASRK